MNPSADLKRREKYHVMDMLLLEIPNEQFKENSWPQGHKHTSSA
jgi:hypothetical protein